MDLGTWLFISLGVLIAVVLPVLSGAVRKEFPATAGAGSIPPWLRKYGLLFLFSAITGVIVYAVWVGANPGKTLDTAGAIVAGFGWESLLEKLTLKSPTKI